MKIQIFSALLFVLYIPLWGQSIPVPENYVIIDSVEGDLDKDGIKEMVAAFDTRKPIEEFDNIPRELHIYKKKSNKWILWKKSEQALYGSRDGGMMGDPFDKIEITNGVLLISQAGGSSWKWNVTDKYRYQNGEFYLIGYSNIFGKPCEYWTEIDFNLNTGKLFAGKEYEDCQGDEPKTIKKENETIWKKGIKISLQQRNNKEIKFTTPRYRHEIYIAENNE